MIIGIDLDGVTYDSQDIIKTAAEVYDVEHGGKGVINKKSPYVLEQYKWNKDECMTFLKDIVWQYTYNAPLKPYAKYVIDYLHDKGHKIYFITSRGGYDLPHEDVLTEKTLEKDHMHFDQIFFGKHNKVKTLKEQHVDVMIDDNINNVKSIAKAGFNVIYFREQGSPAIRHKCVHTVTNWGEIYRYFKKLEDTATKK